MIRTRATLANLTLDAWQELVDSHPESTALHHRHWIETLVEHYHLTCHIPCLQEEGKTVVAIPFLETRSLLGAVKLLSLPFSDCVPVLATREASVAELYRALNEDAHFQKYKSIQVKTATPVEAGDSQGRWVRHELCLRQPWSEWIGLLPSSLRRNVRRAERSGLQFSVRTDREAVETFYRLHLMTRKKLGVPIQPKGFFHRLHERLLQNGLGFIGLVSHNSDTIAASVFLTYNHRMIYKFGASNPRTLSLRPNEAMFFHAIKQARELGHTCFDFGVSHRQDEGLRRFKRKWGAIEGDVYADCVKGDRESSVEESVAMKVASAAIRNSPTAVCRLLGEMFYRFSQ